MGGEGVGSSDTKVDNKKEPTAPEAVPERMKFVAKDRLEMRIGISKALQEKVKRVQDLEAQRTGNRE